MRRFVVPIVALALLCSACQQPTPRLNAPPHGATSNPSLLQDEYDYMANNALLADMNVSDVHFLPGRAALNGLGTERLERLAHLLQLHGGKVRLSTDETDPQLVDGRVQEVVRFLADAGIDTSTEVVTQDLPGSPGQDASEAILIKANEGMYKAKKSAGGGAPASAVDNGAAKGK